MFYCKYIVILFLPDTPNGGKTPILNKQEIVYKSQASAGGGY